MRPMDHRQALMIPETDDFTKCELCYCIPGQQVPLYCYHRPCYGCLKTLSITKKFLNDIQCPLCGQVISKGDGIQSPLCGQVTSITEEIQDPLCEQVISITDGTQSPLCGKVTMMEEMRRDIPQSSVQTPDVPSFSCDLCVEAREAAGTCMTCSEKLCKYCMESHQNSKASKHHRIDIITKTVDCVQQVLITKDTQINVDDRQEAEVSKARCDRHIDSDLTHFCRMCSIPVCKECRKSPEHKGHRTRPLAAAMSDKRRTLAQRAQSVKDGYLTVLGKRFYNTKRRHEEFQHNSSEIITEAVRRAELLKKEIDIACDQVIEEAKENEKTVNELTQKYVEDLEKEMMTVSGFIQNLKNTLNVGDDLEMAKSLKSVLPMLEEYERGESISSLEHTHIEFEPGFLTGDSLRKGFGSVSVKKSGMKWSRSVSIGNGHGTTQGVNVRILSTFECPSLSAVDQSESDDYADDEPIHAMVPVSDNEAWVSSGWETTRIGLVARNGQNKRLVDVDSRIDDFALTPNNELLMSCFREKLIKRLSKDGDIVSEIHTPFFPRGITSCGDGGFIVCMTDDYSTSLASDSRRLLMKYSNENELNDSYEIYEESRLFRRPYRVAENNNGDICVSDRTSMGSGRVIVLFRNGKLRFVYEGPSNNQCERKFAPAGIVCDHLGRILVADTNNHCVHILDQSGQFLGFLLKREDGLVSPHTLSFDRAGGLWIGDELGNIRVFQYTQRSVMS